MDDPWAEEWAYQVDVCIYTATTLPRCRQGRRPKGEYLAYFQRMTHLASRRADVAVFVVPFRDMLYCWICSIAVVVWIFGNVLALAGLDGPLFRWPTSIAVVVWIVVKSVGLASMEGVVDGDRRCCDIPDRKEDDDASDATHNVRG